MTFSATTPAECHFLAEIWSPEACWESDPSGSVSFCGPLVPPAESLLYYMEVNGAVLNSVLDC